MAFHPGLEEVDIFFKTLYSGFRRVLACRLFIDGSLVDSAVFDFSLIAFCDWVVVSALCGWRRLALYIAIFAKTRRFSGRDNADVSVLQTDHQ